MKQGWDDLKDDTKLVKQQFVEFKETQENKLTTSLEELKNDGNKRQLDFSITVYIILHHYKYYIFSPNDNAA